MEARAEDLLPVEYFHLVFTLPAEIAQIAYWNKRAVYGLLFKASARTVTTIAAVPRCMGARVDMTSVLHTWGSALASTVLASSDTWERERLNTGQQGMGVGFWIWHRASWP